MGKKSLKKFKQKNLKTLSNKTETQTNFFKTISKIIYKKKKRKKKQKKALKRTKYPCRKELKKNTNFVKIHKIWHTKQKTEKETKTNKLRC